MSVPIAVSQNSELLHAMTSGMAAALDADPTSLPEIELRGAWLLRCIISFLAIPAESDATERAILESFVVPHLALTPRQQRSTE